MARAGQLYLPVNVPLGPFGWNRFCLADARAVWSTKPCPFLRCGVNHATNQKHTNQTDLGNLDHMKLINSSLDQQPHASKKWRRNAARRIAAMFILAVGIVVLL